MPRVFPYNQLFLSIHGSSLLILCHFLLVFAVLFSIHIHQAACPILLGIKAIIIEIKTLFYSLFYGYLCVKFVDNAIVEVVKTGGNIQLKGGCYLYFFYKF